MPTSSCQPCGTSSAGTWRRRRGSKKQRQESRWALFVSSDEGCLMARRSLTIAEVMTLTALVAADLALIPFDVWSLLLFPVYLALFVSLNVVIVQAFVLGRPLGPFHYTFIVASAVASIVISELMFAAGYSEDDGSWVAWGGACLLTALLARGSGVLVSRRAASRRERAVVRDRTTAVPWRRGAYRVRLFCHRDAPFSLGRARSR